MICPTPGSKFHKETIYESKPKNSRGESNESKGPVGAGFEDRGHKGILTEKYTYKGETIMFGSSQPRGEEHSILE